ncbi:ABC transporter permease subunit [Phototrophicus methaneseepsis]|uniref:ABC transporter permease subunit n=1 Tax=Phototrophicus methaneseepsis TaxID=2710758 RepID=A0A7S8EAM8_9CHLR|nr:ABC transporter permease [Phototrophicus methaneseepsis]QPC83467.1 ABC transporter permease subunit [Phototrophicus methaneseepsis]
MRAVWAVFKRELALFFRSPIIYVIAFALMLLMGLVFSTIVASYSANNQSQFAQQLVTANNAVGDYMGLFTFLLFIFAPLLTMRLLAEEQREGTLEVLMTLPMNDWAFVIGKFLAVWAVFTFIELLTLIYVVLLTAMGVPTAGMVFSAYFGAWLYGGAVLALALVWSAVSEDQLVAAFLGAATILVLYLASSFSGLIGNTLGAGAADFMREVGLVVHYQARMLSGLLQAHDVIYFVLIMGISLFITTLIVGSRRWRSN